MVDTRILSPLDSCHRMRVPTLRSLSLSLMLCQMWDSWLLLFGLDLSKFWTESNALSFYVTPVCPSCISREVTDVPKTRGPRQVGRERQLSRGIL